MAADLFTDAGRMAAAAAAVAAVAVPVGAGCWLAARRLGEPLCPAVKPWRVPCAGYDVVAAMLWLMFVAPTLAGGMLVAAGFFPTVYGPDFPPPVPVDQLHPDASGAAAGTAVAEVGYARATESARVRGLWSGAFALPLQLVVLWVARRTAYPGWHAAPPGPRGLPARVALGVLTWLAVTPVVFAAHFAVNAAFQGLGWNLDEHPLARVGPWRWWPLLDGTLLVVQASVAAPLVEELAFRGVLLPWLLGGSVRPGGLRQRGRVVIVLAVGIAAAAVFTADDLARGHVRGAVVFAVVLAVGWAVVSRLTTKRRTWGAVWASAALFAAVHSSVWPTPVPLFALGLGLGWAAVRTRGVLVPALVHGLFNAISAVFVLNGHG